MNVDELSRGSDDAEEEGAPLWMATYSDVATLLLTFFVLLLSFANLDISYFRIMLGSVKNAFGVQTKVEGKFEGRTTDPVELSEYLRSSELEPPAHPQLAEQTEAVKEYVLRRGMAEKVEVVGTPRGIALRIKDMILFDTGSDRLKAEGSEVLNIVIELFQRFEGRLIIEGHTDNRPIRSPRFPSNWELSTARSTAVLRYLVKQGKLDIKRVGVAGYADVRPLAPNDSDERRAQNRRVEFLFEMAFDASRPNARPKGFRLDLFSTSPLAGAR